MQLFTLQGNNSAAHPMSDYQTSEPSVSSNPNYPERMETQQPMLESQHEMQPQHDNYMNRETMDRVPHPSHPHQRVMQNNPHPPHQQYMAHPVQHVSSHIRHFRNFCLFYFEGGGEESGVGYLE